MASSQVMVSSSPANPDQSSSMHSPLTLSDPNFNMDDLFKNIYAPATVDGGAVGGDRTPEEVWKDIVSGSAQNRRPNMTLEDFMAKASDAVRVEEDVMLPVPVPASGYDVDSIISVPQFQAPEIGSGHGGFGLDSVGFGNGIVAVGGSGRCKRRAVEEPPVDRVTQQKQKRMIKNRESAARSRERKQAYTDELESLVTHLEEENARLMREEEELTRERYNQLMEKLIPVVEKRRPPRVLQRTNSM